MIKRLFLALLCVFVMAGVANAQTYYIGIDDVTTLEGAGPAIFTVSLDQTATVDISVDYATADGSARHPNGSDYPGDYSNTLGTLTISAGASQGVIAVPVTYDGTVELNETFTITLSNIVTVGAAAFSKDTGVGTITDNNNYHIWVDDVTIDEGAGTATFTVSKDQEGDVDISVDYATADGSAVQPGDYTAGAGTLLIAAGDFGGTIDIPIIEDALVEIDETFTITLSNIVGPGMFADATGLGRITDNDYPQASIDDVTVNEGETATFTISLDQANMAEGFVVQYSTADGSAVSPNDYASTQGDLFFAVGASSGTVTVPTYTDAAVEGNETFVVQVSGMSSYDVGVCTIKDASYGSLTVVDGGGSGSGSSFPSVGVHMYELGTVIDLAANPNSGSNFQWSGDANLPADADGSITIDGDKVVIITYHLQTRTVNVISGFGGTTDKDGANVVNYGSTFTVMATADAGYGFQYWAGVPEGQKYNNPLTLTITTDLTVEAIFETVPVDVLVDAELSKFLYVEKPNKDEKLFIHGAFEVGVTDVVVGEEIPASITIVLSGKGTNGGDLIIEADVTVEVTDIEDGHKIVRLKK